MPDHVHLLVEGTSSRSSLARFIAGWKQVSAFHVGRPRRIRLWQPGYFERLLRVHESSQDTARYIVENPLRATLTAGAIAVSFTWSSPHLWGGASAPHSS